MQQHCSSLVDNCKYSFDCLDSIIRYKNLSQRKKILDEIGFEWGDPKKFIDVPFEKAMCALFAYFLIRGDLFVYEDFVMPGE